MEYLPCKDEIAEYINIMDGEKTTLLTVMLDKNKSMVVGGGNQGRYFCYIENEESFISPVTKGPIKGETCRLVMGGQSTDMDAKFCCTKLEILEIVSEYIRSGHAHPAYEWEVT